MDIYQVVNAMAYYNGTNKLMGVIKELNLPNINFQFQDHRGLGMIGSMQYFTGIEPMEATITWASLIPGELKNFANPMKLVEITCYSALENYGSLLAGDTLTESTKITTLIKGYIKTYPLGNFVPGENVSDVTTTMFVKYISQSSDSGPSIEIDVKENVFKVDGSDILEDMAASLF